MAIRSRIEATFVFIPVIPTYIETALKTLYENTPINFRVVVVDQTVDSVYDKVENYVDLYLRPKRRNLGFSKANNEGIIHGLHWGSKFIVACNDDVVFLDPRWWGGVMKHFDNFPDMMAVNPASVIEPGWGYGLGTKGFKVPDWGVLVGDYIYPKKPDGSPLTFEEAKTREGYDWLINDYKKGHIEGFAGWCVVGKREMWEKVGLYDERFYPGGAEDYDLCMRIYLAGGRTSATFNSFVWHHWSRSKEASKNKLPPLSREVYQNVEDLYKFSAEGINSPIFTPQSNRPYNNRRVRKSAGIFVDDIR